MRSTELQALASLIGAEVHSTQSRREAFWIEVRSTEVFLLNWGDAPGIVVRSTESIVKRLGSRCAATRCFF